MGTYGSGVEVLPIESMGETVVGVAVVVVRIVVVERIVEVDEVDEGLERVVSVSVVGPPQAARPNEATRRTERAFTSQPPSCAPRSKKAVRPSVTCSPAALLNSDSKEAGVVCESPPSMQFSSE